MAGIIELFQMLKGNKIICMQTNRKGYLPGENIPRHLGKVRRTWSAVWVQELFLQIKKDLFLQLNWKPVQGSVCCVPHRAFRLVFMGYLALVRCEMLIPADGTSEQSQGKAVRTFHYPQGTKLKHHTFVCFWNSAGHWLHSRDWAFVTVLGLKVARVTLVSRNTVSLRFTYSRTFIPWVPPRHWGHRAGHKIFPAHREFTVWLQAIKERTVCILEGCLIMIAIVWMWQDRGSGGPREPSFLLQTLCPASLCQTQLIISGLGSSRELLR